MFKIHSVWQRNILKDVETFKTVKDEMENKKIIFLVGFDFTFQGKSIVCVDKDKICLSDELLSGLMNMKSNSLNLYSWKKTLIEISKMNASSVCEDYMFYNRNYNYNLSGENTLLKSVVDESVKFYHVYQQFFLRFDRTTLKFVFTFPDRCKCFCGKEFDSYFEKIEHTKNEPNCNFVCYCPLCKENVVQKISNNDKLIESGFESSPSNTLHIHLFFFHDFKNFNLVDLCLKYFQFGISDIDTVPPFPRHYKVNVH